jgi:hypothetical protein
MSPKQFIDAQKDERRGIMHSLHQIIIDRDKTIMPEVELMMGNQMIVYKERGHMKYALASGKNYMSLHCMPMYGSPQLHAKYINLIPAATFQKGCINFNNLDSMPLDVADNLVQDCAKVSIAIMIENRIKK